MHNNLLYYRSNVTGKDCRSIGPASTCFCGHRFKQHATDNVKDKNLHCKERGCKCTLFDYVPVSGAGDLRCMRCKHSFKEHDEYSKTCKRPRCKGCPGFHSSFSCGCSEQWSQHYTVIETRAEREAAGRTVSNLGFGGDMYQALGGVTDYSSLMDPGDRKALEEKAMAMGGGGYGDMMGFGMMPMGKPKLTEADEMDALGAAYDKKVFHILLIEPLRDAVMNKM